MTGAERLPDLVLAPDLAQTRRALQPVLDLATSIAAGSIRGAAGAGLSLIEEGARWSVASTNPLVELADEQQYELGEGPCLTSWADGVLLRVDDLEQESRWSAWTTAARGLHLRSVLSTPVRGTTRTLGAMKVYSEQPRVFDRFAEDLLLGLADQAGILVENLQTLTAAEQSSEAIMAALQTRQQIAAAQGMMMERFHLSPEQAFLRLSTDAQRKGHTLADEAADLISGA
jgi:GAF domain-containing protein